MDPRLGSASRNPLRCWDLSPMRNASGFFTNPKKHFFVIVPGCRVTVNALDMGVTVSQRDRACSFGDVRLKGVS